MRSLIVFYILAIFAASLASSETPVKKGTARSANATDPISEMLGQVLQINVTEAEVRRFINAFPDLCRDKELKSIIDNNANPMEILVAAGTNYTKYDDFAKSKGYSGFEELLSSTGAILSAYSYLKMRDSQAMLEKELKKLPPEAQPAFKSQIEDIQREVKKYSKYVTPATMNAVKKNYAEINAAIEKILAEQKKMPSPKKGKTVK